MAEKNFLLFSPGLSASFVGGENLKRLLLTPEIRRSLIFRNYVLKICLRVGEVIVVFLFCFVLFSKQLVKPP